MQISHYIKGIKIYLREVRVSDVTEKYYNWMNDSVINQFLETRYVPQSMNNIEEFVRKMDGKSDEIFLAICDINTNEHIGNIKVGPINMIHRFADVSLLIGDKDYWGKGIATEAIKLIIEFSFNTLNLNKLKASCYEENIASALAFEKSGFIHEGVLKKMWYKNGYFQDHILLGLCKEDFFKKIS
jgi:[ribosomal protein S5]-alanine N-acetyltransferase